MLLTLALAGLPALAGPDDAPSADDTNEPVNKGRYRNRFVGVGLYSQEVGTGVAFRNLKVRSPRWGKFFGRGSDFEFDFVPNGLVGMQFRYLLGATYLPPVEGLRLGLFSGVGAQLTMSAPDFQFDLFSATAGVTVPVIAEVGYAVIDNVGLHLRGGANIGLRGITFSAEDETLSDGLPTQGEIILSASFGTRDGARVRGLRIEGGRIGPAWTVLVGFGG